MRRAHTDDPHQQAPICPGCGVTALPADSMDSSEFRCENPDCELFDTRVR